MKSGRLRKFAVYCVLLTPGIVLCALLVIAGVGVWISAILRNPAMLDGAPQVIHTLARAAYWRHRTHWHTVSDCTEFDETLLYKPRPGSCSFSNSEFTTTPHFDDLGLRRTAAKADAGATIGAGRRLLLLGDSHTMGWGVEDAETYASALAARHGFETLNLAVSSYGTAREVTRLRLLGLLRPDDIILIQYCSNDLEENAYFLSHEALPRRTPADFAALQTFKPAPNDPINVTATLLRIAWQDLAQPLARLTATTPAAAAAPPSAAQTFVQVLERFPELREHRIFVIELNGHGYKSGFSDELAALKRDNLVVITPELPRENFYQIDDHLTAQGHEKLAAQLAQAIGQTMAAAYGTDGSRREGE